jgi:hypothetical protein
MPEVEGIDKFISVIPRKRFGIFCKYGTSQYGFSKYGDNDIYFIRTCYGVAIYGFDIFADVIPLSGIYRTDNVTGETKVYREPYYITRNPRTSAQQAQRQKFGNAVRAWQALTQNDKNVYNTRAKYKPYSGYNLFLKEYLSSN